MEEVLTIARQVAKKAAVEAGRLAKARFFSGFKTREKGEYGDLVTEVDEEADRLIVNRIRKYFPDHRIRSEEQGTSGEEDDWMWWVDPLDGTNNYALGIPLYGVCITLFHREQPVLGVIYDSHLKKVYTAEKGKGAFCDSQPLLMRKKRSFPKMTVGWIQGHQVQKEREAMALKQALDERFKRVLRLWAPSLLWCMVARGDVDGIVLYNSEGEDLYAGVMMVREAGGAVFDFDGRSFDGMNSQPYLVACHPEDRDLFLHMVREVLDRERKGV